MRPPRRRSTSSRTRAVPVRSRVTVRRPQAKLLRTDRLAEMLRDSRQALLDIEGELDALLDTLRNPAAPLDERAADRLQGATRQAAKVIGSLENRRTSAHRR